MWDSYSLRMAPGGTWIHKPYGFPMVPLPPPDGSLQVYPPMCSLNLGKRISHHRFGQQKHFTKKKKDHQMVKNTCVPANYLCPGPKKWCLPGNPKWGPERLFWLEFSGPCFGSGGNSLPKIRGHYSWVLSYCPTSSTQGLGRGNTSSTPRLGKLIAIHPMEVDGLKDHFPIQKMGDGCKWSSS